MHDHPPHAARLEQHGLSLADRIRDLIRREGPISVERFMAMALSDPDHGYYATRAIFGVDGDFTTAPEISQMFGELLGIWAIGCWKALGSPETIRIVELGPGRGTLMRDLLRALKVAPAMRAGLAVALVETSATLTARQRETLGAAAETVVWHERFEDVPRDRPMIVIANEFLDALPIRQFVLTPAGLRERMVVLGEAGRFRFGAPPRAALDDTPAAPIIVEMCPAAEAAVEAVASGLVHTGGYALFIDYGHARTQRGETLQAVRAHRFVDPLSDPGQVDLTAHVDFAAVARAAEAAGASVWPLLRQGMLLARLGIETRMQRLMTVGGEAALRIESECQRLVDDRPTGMGRLFKAFAISAPHLPAPPAFELPDAGLAVPVTVTPSANDVDA
jgi:SAM-dependent MidA family methyltransferase